MYCVIGEKILKCEVSEKLENYSWVRIGKTEKGQTIPNNRIFKTEEAAREFIKNRNQRKASNDKSMTDEISTCKRLYDNFLKETGIMVRVIDRCFKVAEVEKQLAHLRKKYDKSEDANQGSSKAPKDSRAYSTKPSSSFKTKSEPPTSPNNSFGKFSKSKPSGKFDKTSKAKPSDSFKPKSESSGRPTNKFNNSTKQTSKRTYK